MFKLIGAFIFFVFIAIISIWLIVGVGLYKASEEIEQNGLKGLSQKIWCGKTGCPEDKK